MRIENIFWAFVDRVWREYLVVGGISVYLRGPYWEFCAIDSVYIVWMLRCMRNYHSSRQVHFEVKNAIFKNLKSVSCANFHYVSSGKCIMASEFNRFYCKTNVWPRVNEDVALCVQLKLGLFCYPQNVISGFGLGFALIRDWLRLVYKMVCFLRCIWCSRLGRSC